MHEGHSSPSLPTSNSFYSVMGSVTEGPIAVVRSTAGGGTPAADNIRARRTSLY